MVLCTATHLDEGLCVSWAGQEAGEVTMKVCLQAGQVTWHPELCPSAEAGSTGAKRSPADLWAALAPSQPGRGHSNPLSSQLPHDARLESLPLWISAARNSAITVKYLP